MIYLSNSIISGVYLYLFTFSPLIAENAIYKLWVTLPEQTNKYPSYLYFSRSLPSKKCLSKLLSAKSTDI
jgi:hypothetical protein